MKKILTITAIAVFSMGAWFSDVEKQDIPDQNILSGSNPGGENGLSKWVVSTGSITAETANPGFGASSISWDAGAASETLRSADVVVPDALEGQSCLVEVYYKLATGASGDIVLRVELDDGSAITQDLDLSVSTKWVKAQMGFVCPTNDSIHIELASTANAGAILIDNAYLGRDHRLGDTTPITGWEKYTPSNTQGFGTITSDNLQWRRSGEEIWIRGYFTTGTTVGSEAQISFPDGLTASLSGGDSHHVGEVLKDATQGVARSERFPVLVTSGDTYVTFGMDLSNGTTNVTDERNGSGTFVSSTRFTINAGPIPIAEWAGSGTPQVTLDTQGWFARGHFTNTNFTVLAADVPAYEAASASTMLLVNDNPNVPIGIACDGTVENDPGDLSCTGDDEQSGFVVDVPYVMDALICFEGGQRVTTTGNVATTWQVMRRANNAQTILQDGGSAPGILVDNTNAKMAINVCGVFNSLSVGKHTFSLMYEQLETPSTTVNRLESDENATIGDRKVSFYMLPLTQNFPQAVALVGDYEELDISSQGEFNAGQPLVRIERLGNRVTMSFDELFHSSASTPGSDAGFIPVRFRPDTSTPARNIYFLGTSFTGSVMVRPDGEVEFQYFNWSGSLTSRTDSVTAGSVTWLLGN